jgi:CHAD domain-containing protein
MRTVQGAAALALVAALGDSFDHVELHRLRRQVRRLRYAAEVSATLKGQVASAATELRVLQDQLGALHDTSVLSEWFARQAAACTARGSVEVAREAAALRDLFLEAARAHHRAFLASAPAEVIARALAAMGQSRPAA